MESVNSILVLGLLVLLILAAIANSVLRRGDRDARPGFGPDRAQRAAMVTEEMVFSKILVPTTGAGLSDRMVTLACKLARPDAAEVEVVYVVEVPLRLPATADMPEEVALAGEVLVGAEVIGRAHNVRVRGRVMKSRFAGKAIVDVAEQQGADLIILAAPEQRHGEWARISEYVFRNAPCDVITERTARK